jgi:PTH1 family peptidyl-tRNA hydrolase
MKLFVGLGNPGAEHARQRHNVGFMAVDRIAADHGFGPWKVKFGGLASEGRLGEVKLLLLKPQTFMNLSGQSVGEAMRFLKLTPADVTVFHDELDLPPGRVRLKQGGGHAGHNGLRSLHQHIGPDYARVRIGIGHPGGKERVTGWVLGDFAKADSGWLEDLLAGLSEGAPALAAGQGARFIEAVNRRTARPDEPPAATVGQVPRQARQGEARRREAQARAEQAIAAAPGGPLAQLLRRFVKPG